MANITDRFGRPSIPGDYAGATTVKTARTPSESVLSCFDLSKFPLDTPAYFITYRKEIDPVTGVVKVVNQVSWKALVNADNNTLTNLIPAPGYVDTGNQVGDYVECIPSALWANDLVEGLLASHNPDGTLKSPIGIGKTPTQGTLDVAGDIYSNGEKVSTYVPKTQVGVIPGSVFGSTGARTFNHNMGKKPGVIRFNILPASNTSNANMMQGVVDSSLNQWANSIVAQGVGGAGRASHSSRAIHAINTPSTVYISAEVTAITESSITFQVYTANTGYDVGYEAGF